MSNFAVTSSPHMRDKATSQRIMQEVCLALAPAGIAGIMLYGFNAALLIAICVATCVLSEFAWQKATKQTVTISDWSAVVTGLLLAYNLPATAPWWIAVIGSILAIVVVKQFFGGIGSNFMNPALTARAILFISWSGIMGAYPKANPFQFTADAVTGATPLATLNGGTTEGLNLLDLLLGNHGGVLGGISSGQQVVCSVAFKPTSSLRLPVAGVDLDGNAVEVVTTGRHDPCVGIRATPICEAMMALELIDQALRHRAQCGDVGAVTPRIPGEAAGGADV